MSKRRAPRSTAKASQGALRRVRVAKLERLFGTRFPVLDDGFVRVIDYMGSDESIVQAARISYGAGTKRVQEDRGLIRYLMRHHHTTPFEMCELKLHVRAPMDCWRQWIRHRTASVNEYSTRYSEAIDGAQRTAPVDWRLQSGSNKQGSSGTVAPDVGKHLSLREQDFQRLARELYEERLSRGIAREQARKDLPLSTYTEAYWKIDLHNLFHFLALRMDAHAQPEIRAYAEVIGNEIVRHWCPVAWDAFCDFRLHAVSLSAIETTVVAALARGSAAEAVAAAKAAGLLASDGSSTNRSREREDLEAKLRRLGYRAPW